MLRLAGLSPLRDAAASWTPDQIVNAVLKLGAGLAVFAAVVYLLGKGMDLAGKYFDYKKSK